MRITEVSKFAQDKGYTLQILLANDTYLYWLENSYFIGKPFECLEDLITFLQKLPIMPLERDNLIVQKY